MSAMFFVSHVLCQSRVIDTTCAKHITARALSVNIRREVSELTTILFYITFQCDLCRAENAQGRIIWNADQRRRPVKIRWIGRW